MIQNNEKKRNVEEEADRRKCIKLSVGESQVRYINQMKEARKKKEMLYKVGDFVRIKIDKVDKITAVHLSIQMYYLEK